MKIKRDLQIKAIALRKSGHSLSEIAKMLNVAKSSASLWVRNVNISKTAIRRILSRSQEGVQRGADRRRVQAQVVKDRIYEEAIEAINQLKTSKAIDRLILSIMYWCEGGKDDTSVSFTNSDPKLVRSFIDLLVTSFDIDRNKISARLHLHEYHNPEIQLALWSKNLDLDKNKFKKFYLKPNTGTRKRENYPGCINIRYYDSFSARKLLYLAQAYLNKKGA